MSDDQIDRSRRRYTWKSGLARDVHISKTGHTTITVVQANGARFKTLAKNVKGVGDA